MDAFRSTDEKLRETVGLLAGGAVLAWTYLLLGGNGAMGSGGGGGVTYTYEVDYGCGSPSGNTQTFSTSAAATSFIQSTLIAPSTGLSFVLIQVGSDGSRTQLSSGTAPGNCSGGGGTGTLFVVVVRNSTGQPITGCSISVDGVFKGNTGSPGLSVPNLSPGAHSVMASFQGTSQTTSVTIVSGQTTSITMNLPV